MPRDSGSSDGSKTHHLRISSNGFCSTVYDKRLEDGWGDGNLKLEGNEFELEKLVIVQPKIIQVASPPSPLQFDSDTDEFSESESTSSGSSRDLFPVNKVNLSESEDEGCSTDEAADPVTSTTSLHRSNRTNNANSDDSSDSDSDYENNFQDDDADGPSRKYNTDLPPEGSQSQERNKILLNFRLPDIALKYDPKLAHAAFNERPAKNPFYKFIVDETGEAQYRFLPNEYYKRRKDFAYQPVPIGIQMKCLIVRRRTKISPYCTYVLYLERSEEKKTLIMAARKRKKSKTGNYVITLESGDLHRSSANYVGKIRSNFFGTKFFIYNDGDSVESKISKELIDSYSQTIQKTTDVDSEKEKFPLRKEFGLISYNQNVLGLKGPRKMKFYIPAMINESMRLDFKPSTPSESISRTRKMGNMKNKGVIELQNKDPLWVESSQTYVLNFHGRATQPSVKNFQIIDSNDSEYLILQSGRIGQNYFTLDFRFPLCPLQAFGMALASFERKLACD